MTLARTRWYPSTFSSRCTLSSNQRRQLTFAAYRMKNSWERQDLSPGCWVQSKTAILWLLVRFPFWPSSFYPSWPSQKAAQSRANQSNIASKLELLKTHKLDGDVLLNCQLHGRDWRVWYSQRFLLQSNHDAAIFFCLKYFKIENPFLNFLRRIFCLAENRQSWGNKEITPQLSLEWGGGNPTGEAENCFCVRAGLEPVTSWWNTRMRTPVPGS